jgi:hypothetical protein
MQGIGENSSDELRDRVAVIQEAIRYSAEYRGRWFVIHANAESLAADTFREDLLLLRSLGIHVAVICPRGRIETSTGPSPAKELRAALNLNGLTAVELEWSETRTNEISRRAYPTWLRFGQDLALIVVINSEEASSLSHSVALSVECAAAKTMFLDDRWDPSAIPVGGPGSDRPTPEVVRPLIRTLGDIGRILQAAVDAAEAGVEEVHIVPVAGRSHPVLVEIFTSAGVGTWVGR